MNFDLKKSIELLERSPKTYETLFCNLNYNWNRINEGQNTWSAYSIIGHLIHGEKTDWIPRAKIILNQGDKNFEPYDRFAQEKLYSTQTFEELITEFKILRINNVEELKSWNLTEQDLNKEGIHPDLGIVTLKQLISTWTIHDIIHLNQISRVIVKHYGEDIGPWKKYVRLLNE
ncbi:DinB family protein [Hyunsoonleella pacifica]|uniref:DinB family protein n=1 Tax=Hyunsoonleella pacifica TaxID=1080224 RepID=A0A4V2JAT4_9FLAO|nr:DinB family protein [Hyunsoonleella pacifica]TBN14578.1 DinB family protein [Hyunsoonleella pacifica]GGD14965.1 hypothetical protein GCM10011368_16130 [Hyunsoonleella pacifica]